MPSPGIFRVSFILLTHEGLGRAGGCEDAFWMWNFWELWVRAHIFRIFKGKVVFLVVALDSGTNQCTWPSEATVGLGTKW